MVFLIKVTDAAQGKLQLLMQVAKQELHVVGPDVIYNIMGGRKLFLGQSQTVKLNGLKSLFKCFIKCCALLFL